MVIVKQCILEKKFGQHAHTLTFLTHFDFRQSYRTIQLPMIAILFNYFISSFIFFCISYKTFETYEKISCKLISCSITTYDP